MGTDSKNHAIYSLFTEITNILSSIYWRNMMFGAGGVMTDSECGSGHDGVSENNWLIFVFYVTRTSSRDLRKSTALRSRALQNAIIFRGHPSQRNETQSPRPLISLRDTYFKPSRIRWTGRAGWPTDRLDSSGSTVAGDRRGFVTGMIINQTHHS